MRKGLVFAGLLVLGTGFYIVLLAIGVMPDAGVLDPRWILGLAGMALVVGGGLVSIGELMNHSTAVTLRDIEVVRAFRNVMITLLLIIFSILGNWVAFGPGARPMQMALAVPFTEISLKPGEWVGRFSYGIIAILLDAIIVVMIFSFIRGLRKGRLERGSSD